MKIDLESFVSELENYEFGVKYIIPTDLKFSNDIDSSFTDELDNILDTRTYIEKQLRLYPEEEQLKTYLARLKAADNLLRAKREIVLKVAPDFAKGRARLRQVPPETYWWWYLDNPDLVEVRQEIVYISQNRLGIAFDESVVARAGLQAGQSVKITADTKHILVSIQE